MGGSSDRVDELFKSVGVERVDLSRERVGGRRVSGDAYLDFVEPFPLSEMRYLNIYEFSVCPVFYCAERRSDGALFLAVESSVGEDVLSFVYGRVTKSVVNRMEAGRVSVWDLLRLSRELYVVVSSMDEFGESVSFVEELSAVDLR